MAKRSSIFIWIYSKKCLMFDSSVEECNMNLIFYWCGEDSKGKLLKYIQALLKGEYTRPEPSEP